MKEETKEKIRDPPLSRGIVIDRLVCETSLECLTVCNLNTDLFILITVLKARVSRFQLPRAFWGSGTSNCQLTRLLRSK